MIAAVAPLLWPLGRAAAALVALARAARIPVGEASGEVVLDGVGDDAVARGLAALARRLDLELLPVEAPYPEVADFLRGAGPALLLVRDGSTARLLLLLDRGAATLPVLAPDGSVAQVAVETLRGLFCQVAEEWVDEPIRALLERLDLPARRIDRVRRALVDQQLEPIAIGPCFLLRPAPQQGLMVRLARRGLPRLAALLLIGQVLYTAGFIASWTWIGRAALGGRFDASALSAWVLLLLSLIPVRLLIHYGEGVLALKLGAAVRERLLAGVLRTPHADIAADGAGRHLSRVLEAESFETLGFTGGLGALFASVEIVGALWVLAFAPLPVWQISTLLAFVVLTGVLTWLLLRRAQRFAAARIDSGQDLIERMIGHRTRLVQASAARRHDGEDEKLARYVERSRDHDRVVVLVAVALARAYLVLAMLGLLVPFATQADRIALAIGSGGVLLAYQALARLAGGMHQLVSAWTSWRVIRPLYVAAATPERQGDALAEVLAAQRIDDAHAPLLDARGLRFAYPGGREVLRDATLALRKGDRVRLVGPSGGGKSTLASVLLGLESHSAGSIRLRGIDRHTLGDAAWRRHVTAVPQFHRNHIFSGSLAFNLLLGRSWPATADDLARAGQLCEELGLGGMLARMPGGMLQQVGETGWQLSHGERNRVFIARALLQGGDVLLLDESFAALDPATLEVALSATLRHAETVLWIAHP